MFITKLTVYFKGSFFCLLLFFITSSSYSQVPGCNDPLANNYNSAATVNDGSCSYTPLNYAPPIKVDPLSDSLTESSGLQMAGNFLWTFNDGGGAAAIYRIDTITNTVLQKVNLDGAVNIDWEDISFDGTSFYVGDFGNNANGARTDLKIYKFPLSAIPDYIDNPVATIPASQIQIINFLYSDQPQPPEPTENNNTKFDCEAMIVDGGKIHLFTKDWIAFTTTHYEIDGLGAGNYIATPVETFLTNYLVTAADKVKGQRVIALLGYKPNGTGKHYMHLLTDYNSERYFSGNKRQLDLPDVFVMGQAEGLCFRTNRYGYISNEKIIRYLNGIPVISISQKLRSFDISTFISGNFPVYRFTGDGNWDNAANWSDNIQPPDPLPLDSEIIIDPANGGRCVLNISYTIPAGSKLTVRSSKDFVITGNLVVQ